MKSGKNTVPNIVKESDLPKINTCQFPIVGIGASAGGLEALEQFFANMPSDSGMAFVIIQHLDPTQPSIMSDLLQRITHMKVMKANDRLKVMPDSVYVIPPNKSLSVLNGVLHLFAPPEIRGLRLPVDIFFRSLADDLQDKSIGIILSGMGSDGSLGLKAIKERNGLVLVQDPSNAKFDGMPQSAIDSVNVDIVAAAAELPAKLIDYLKFVPLVKPNSEIDHKTISNIDKIIILLREQTGHDFSLYKKSTLFRRIERRKGVHLIDKLPNYIRLLQENPKELDILFKEFLIGVTNFFRDADVWKKLKEDILPSLINDAPEGHILRAWIPGCSTGEEAYSLAIIFKEVLEERKIKKKISLQIYASDIDQDAVEKARKGLFSLNISGDVSPERLSSFFTAEGDNYRIKISIREMVVFALQNVIRDPPFTKLDILSCRNMLIYMEPELQGKLMVLFNYSLNAGGIMLLGSAETPGNMKDNFNVLDTKLKIYKRSSTITSPTLINFPSSFYHNKKMTTEKTVPEKGIENIQSVADQIILQRFAPASVLVNDAGDIIYITGRTGKYLEPVAGKANWNIYAMAREGLAQELPAAFRKVLQNYEALILRNIKIGTNGGTQYVDVTMQRIDTPGPVQGMIIIVFNDIAPLMDDSPNSKTRDRISSASYKKIELDLQQSYEQMQHMREEMQASQEELKSTNEELQSTNEELQSTNEELTTSKEEMQSLNEELQTVNSELQSKVNEFLQANNDMKNLLNSTEIATLFLDKELNIRRFTESLTNLFKLRSADIGRPFTDLATDLQYPQIVSHAHQVLKTLTSIETSITTNNGRWYSIRIMPYRTVEDRIEGLVITFNDITKSKLLEMELTKANNILQNNSD